MDEKRGRHDNLSDLHLKFFLINFLKTKFILLKLLFHQARSIRCGFLTLGEVEMYFELLKNSPRKFVQVKSRTLNHAIFRISRMNNL